MRWWVDGGDAMRWWEGGGEETRCDRDTGAASSLHPCQFILYMATNASCHFRSHVNQVSRGSVPVRQRR